jgi:hypothetical protein
LQISGFGPDGFIFTRPSLLHSLNFFELTMATFLTLPPGIRERIYVHSHCVRPCPIDITNERSRRRCTSPRHDSVTGSSVWECPRYRIKRQVYRMQQARPLLPEDEPSGQNCECPPLQIQLLRTCRLIHFEMTKIIYSLNKFKLLLTENVEMANAPGALAIRWMTSLEIRVNECACVTNHMCKQPRRTSHFVWDRDELACSLCHMTCTRSGDVPLSRHDVLLQSWLRFSRVLETNLENSNLWFSLICDCKDIETAKLVVAPLERFPKLGTPRMEEALNHTDW